MLSGKLGPGKKIIILENEMASNVYPWQNLCSETGAELCIVPFPGPGESWIAAILSRLDDSIEVVAVSATHWCDGSAIDLQLLSSALYSTYNNETRPFFIIDGTQSVGAMHVDVKALRPDMMSCSVHKWLLCGRGMSLVYLNPRHHNSWSPLDHHDRTREGSQYFFWDELGTMRGVNISVPDGWTSYPENFMPGARRIDSGGGHNFVQLAMLRESLTLLTTRWTPERIYPYLTFLTDRLAALITEAFPAGPLSVLPKQQRSGNILGVRVDVSGSWSVSPGRIVEEMKTRHNIHIALRFGVIRLSPYIFNTEADVLRVVACLVDVINTLGYRPRVLITGGTGWMAQHLYKALSPAIDGRSLPVQCDIHLTCRESTVRPSWAPIDRCHVMELSGPNASANADDVLGRVRPDFIIHLAAVSALAACETDPTATDTNAPIGLLDAINKHVPDVLIIFMSSSIVYAGREEPYEAMDPNNEKFIKDPPVCQYGKSKLRFEKLLVSSIKNYVVLRLGNSLGTVPPFRPQGENFLQFLERFAHKRIDIDIKNDEVRSFLDVKDVVWVMIQIVTSPQPTAFVRKVFNLGGPECISRVELAKKICHSRDIPIEVLNANDTVVFSTTDQYDPSIQPWRFHSVSQTEFDVRNPPVPGKKVLHVPVKLILDSTATESTFGFKFKTIDQMLSTTPSVVIRYIR